MKQQTGVEYLIEKLKSGELKFKITKKSLIISQTCDNDHIAIALQMEKQQMMDAFQRGISYKTEQNISSYYSSKRFHKKYF
jgi:secreted Zn-dependent insulinase-like peptidase